MKLLRIQAHIMGKLVHPIGTLTGSIGKFDLEMSNLTNLV